MKAPAVAKPKENVPPKPFSGQTMINVAGRKFLVIPHPVIESPPPSPPLTNQNPAPAAATSTSTNQRPPPPGPPLPRTEKLNVMLKPAEPEAASSSGAPMPCFDVEMTAEGKYLLVPRDSSASSSSSRNVFSTPAEAGSSSNLAQSAAAAQEELRLAALDREEEDQDEIEREMMGSVEPDVQSTEAEEDNLNLDEMMEEMEQD